MEAWTTSARCTVYRHEKGPLALPESFQDTPATFPAAVLSVACGSLDNICSMYNLNPPTSMLFSGYERKSHQFGSDSLHGTSTPSLSSYSPMSLADTEKRMQNSIGGLIGQCSYMIRPFWLPWLIAHLGQTISPV